MPLAGETMKQTIRILCLVMMLPWLGSCIKLGPEYRRPDPPSPVPPAYQNAGTDEADSWSDAWWREFANPEIDQYVREALGHNLDIQQATARILELRADLRVTRSDRFPSLDVRGQFEKERYAARETDTFSVSLPASFELDLWGRLAGLEEAARADLLAVESSRRTVAQAVIAETVSLYLEMESFERRIQITEQSIENYRRSLRLVQGRYERGLTSILDLRQARRTLAGAEAELPLLRRSLGITQQKLSVLIGRYPETRPARTHPPDYFKHLPPIPSGLPSELVERRPDIAASEAALTALNARVGAALAARFPRIQLTGNFGYASEELGSLVTPGNQIWSLAAGILQPLFDAGALKASQRRAEARYRRGVAEYARTVLDAFAEVEEALLSRKEQLERRERVLVFLEEARATQQVAETRYERGVQDYLSVLDAQQTRFGAEDTLVQADLAVLANRVTLHRVLGGGWGELPPVNTEDTLWIF